MTLKEWFFPAMLAWVATVMAAIVVFEFAVRAPRGGASGSPAGRSAEAQAPEELAAEPPQARSDPRGSSPATAGLSTWPAVPASRSSQTRHADEGETLPATSRPPRVRQAAVAGLFYPRDAKTLSEMIDGFLAKVVEEPVANVRGLVCPHAGYEFSGPTAAFSYKLLAGKDVRTVIVLCPSHYADFAGAYVLTEDVFATPLGEAPVSPRARELARIKPFTSSPRARVDRPSWWRQSPRTAPAAGEDTPDTWEHSGEVQVPFLQRVLGGFEIVPVVFGRVDPIEAAKALEGQIDERTVIVASSDLSHYHPYDQARALDTRCLEAICSLDIEAMKGQEACGAGPIMALMHLAKLKGWQARLLDYRNSGDTAGGKDSVVGYGAVVFYEPARTEAGNYSPEDRKALLDLARRTIKETVASGRAPSVDESKLSRQLTERKGCFVTLTEGGQLRGCIGHILPEQPLYKAIMDTAEGAALHDGRFPPVRADELDKLEIEISVLTPPEPLQFKSPQDLLNRLQPGKDGVILKVGRQMATYLPQVWEQIPDKADFMSSLARKAGLPADAWKTQPAAVLIYHVEAFKESER